MSFNIDIHVHFHPDKDGNIHIPLLKLILDRINHMSAELDTLVAKVTALETVEESAIVLLQGLKAALDEAIAAGDVQTLQALSDRLAADTQKLADAILANTLAEPLPPEPAPEPAPEPVA